jgi:acetoacetate decarboxylase
MKNGSYFIPRDQIYPFMNPGAMNNEEGLYLYWETDPAAARRVLPPVLELPDPAHPISMVYVVNIREPTFAPWYMEGGICLLSATAKPGVFPEPPAQRPARKWPRRGRELSGLPKKVCERMSSNATATGAAVLIRARRKIFCARRKSTYTIRS